MSLPLSASVHAPCCSISRLYIEDACISDRNNELGLKTVKQVSCSSASDASTNTCNSVMRNGKLQQVAAPSIVNATFALIFWLLFGHKCSSSSKAQSVLCNAAPSGTIVNGTIANSGGDYDSGDVCAAQDNAYIYASNTCSETLPIQVTVCVSAKTEHGSCIFALCILLMLDDQHHGRLQHLQAQLLTGCSACLQVTSSDYKGHICLDIAGRHINGVGIALIVAAILIVIVLLALVCYCCCCRW